MYLNKPLDPSLRTFKDETFHWIHSYEVPQEGYVTIAIDPAISEKDDACDTSITAVRHVLKGGLVPYQYWLRDVNGKFNPMQTVEYALNMAQDLGSNLIIVETVAYQKALKYALNDEIVRRGATGIHVRATNSRQEKKARIFAMEPMFANGRVFFIRGLSKQVESQLKQFPNGRFVDTIDSFSMHMLVYRGERVATPAVKPEVKDAMEFEQVILGLRKKYANSKRAGCLATGLDSATTFPGMSLQTGLGSHRDIGVLVESMRN